MFILAAPSACGGSGGSGGTTAAPTTAAPTCASVGGITHWVGDNWCDDENNNAACNYDGGDCCKDTLQWYCTVS